MNPNDVVSPFVIPRLNKRGSMDGLFFLWMENFHVLVDEIIEESREVKFGIE